MFQPTMLSSSSMPNVFSSDHDDKLQAYISSPYPDIAFARNNSVRVISMDFVAELKGDTDKTLEFHCFEIFAKQYCEFRKTVEKHRTQMKQDADCDYADSLKLMQILHSHLEYLQFKTALFA